MRRSHLEQLQPVCPVCRLGRQVDASLDLARIEHEHDDIVVEGVLHCSNPDCLLEYPILDGVPVLVPDIRRWVSENLHHLTARDDLAEATEGLLGDAAGPGSYYDATRQHLSTYAWDHYGLIDPDESRHDPDARQPRPGAAVRCLERGAELLPQGLDAPVLDLGCAVGGVTFASTQLSDGLVLGVDLNFSMLRLASGILRTGRVRYPRRRVGIVYDRRDFEARFEHAGRVDFWACDALALPFPAERFGAVVGLNVLDCTTSPRDVLEAVARTLRPGGSCLLATPYDWSPGATSVEAWIGGHSQRGPDRGAAEPFLRRLLTPGAHPQSVTGLRLTGEIPRVPWHARLHDRSTMTYEAHLVAAQAGGSNPGT